MTRVALRTGAPLGRRVSCALIDPSAIRMDAAAVQRALVEPRIALPRIAVAVLRGDDVDGGGLVLLPSGESAWLPGDALAAADEPNACRVTRPCDALAVRMSTCWVACDPPDEPAWTVDRFDSEYVYLQLDADGPLYRALPEDLGGLDGAVPWCDVAAALSLDVSQPAATAVAWATFQRRLLGEVDDGPRIRGADRWTVDIPGPHVEPAVGETAAPDETERHPVSNVATIASEAQGDPPAPEIRTVIEVRDREAEATTTRAMHPRLVAPPRPTISTRMAPDALPVADEPPVRQPGASGEAAVADPPRPTPTPRSPVADNAGAPLRHARASHSEPELTSVAPPRTPTASEAQPRVRASEPAVPRPDAPPVVRLAATQTLTSAFTPRPGASTVAATPAQPRAATASVVPVSAAPTAAQERARIEPPTRRAPAALSSPPLLRGVSPAAPEAAPMAAPVRAQRRGGDESTVASPRPPHHEPTPTDVEYRAGATSVEIGTIEVQLGVSRSEPARRGDPAGAPPTRATTRTGSLLAEIPRSRTWKGYL